MRLLLVRRRNVRPLNYREWCEKNDYTHKRPEWKMKEYLGYVAKHEGLFTGST